MEVTQCDFLRSARMNQDFHKRKPNVLIFALNGKVNEIQTSAGPAVFWLRARHLCFLDGRAPLSGEIMGLLKFGRLHAPLLSRTP